MPSLLPGPRRQGLTPAMQTAWAELAHAHFLNGLMQAARWRPHELAFHGGTNLHLCWRSARYSEDLDFLLSSSHQDMSEALARTTRHVQAAFHAIDPDFQVELRNKTRDGQRMVAHHLVVSHPRVLGHAMIKCEFWRTDPLYLQNYPTALKQIQGPADYHAGIHSLIPSATLGCAYADKLVAFATRPHLKWRDLYDLWWIENQSPVPLDEASITRQFLHNLQAYQTADGLSPDAALGHLFRKHSRAALIQAADPDLKNWLPQALWQQLHPGRIPDIVDHVQHRLETFSQHAALLLQAQAQGPQP